jgi:hypothetical protein
MGARGWRLRAVLADRFWLVCGAVVVVAALGAMGAYSAHVAPGTHQEQRLDSEARYTGEFTHSATVVRENPVFERGTTLSDRAAYFSRLTPVLNGSLEYRYGATDGGSVRVSGTVTMIARSVSRGTGDGQVVYWETSRELTTTERDAVEPGETVALEFSRNVTALANETRQIDRQMGETPGEIRVRLVADVTTTGEVNGAAVERQQAYALGLDPSETGVYGVQSDTPITNSTSQYRTITVANTPGPLASVGGPLALLCGLLAVVVLGQGRYRGAFGLDDTERAYLRYATDREEFDEWISTASVPRELESETVVDVETLSGLVDLAIDNGRRVLRDGSNGPYLVLDTECTYRYEPPRRPRDGPWVGVLPVGRGRDRTDPLDDGGADEGADGATAETDEAE